MNVVLSGDEEGLVGYWGLDEGSGTTAGDSSANGNDGMIYNANWYDGGSGSTFTTRSPSSVKTILKTPWVAGCCGPIFNTISPVSIGDLSFKIRLLVIINPFIPNNFYL